MQFYVKKDDIQMLKYEIFMSNEEFPVKMKKSQNEPALFSG